MSKENPSVFVRWFQKKYSPTQQVVFIILQGVIFLALLPLLFYWLSRWLDRLLHWVDILPGGWHWVLGLILLVPGFGFAFWAVLAEVLIGGGTPVPVMPTQKLVVRPPFTYCRNPMGLGTTIALVGVGLLFNSPSFVGVSLIFGILLFLYYKFIEEKELVERFGEEYLAYRDKTPFLFLKFKS